MSKASHNILMKPINIKIKENEKNKIKAKEKMKLSPLFTILTLYYLLEVEITLSIA